MSHFRAAGCQAVVVGSYGDHHPPGWSNHPYSEYILLLRDGGTSAWYPDDVLTLIAPDRHDLFDDWIPGRYPAVVGTRQTGDNYNELERAMSDATAAMAADIRQEQDHAIVAAITKSP